MVAKCTYHGGMAGRKQTVTAETGQEFGRLTIRELGRHPKNNRPAALVECRGSAETPHDLVTKWISIFHLVSGSQVRSCGCLQKEAVARVISDSPDAQRMREWRQWRNSPDWQPKQRWRRDEHGRECSYSGRGSCGHQYKPWSAYSGDETRCRSCMVVKATEYLEDEPDEVKQRRAERQRAYSKTPQGRETNRKSRLKHRYGITDEEYEYLESLEGPGICHIHLGLDRMKRNGQVIALSVEHAHDCDKGHDPKNGCSYCIRGLSCYNCNGYIGTVESSPLGSRLRERFADYLARRPLLDEGAPQ